MIKQTPSHSSTGKKHLVNNNPLVYIIKNIPATPLLSYGKRNHGGFFLWGYR